MTNAQRIGLVIKRAIDLTIAGAALVLLSPLIAVLAVVVAVTQGRPVLYTSTRVGRNNKPFKLYKFRSMTNKCDAQGRPLPDAERITPTGRFIRGTSLDELPQLWNIFKGDMSIVGPRPLPPTYLDRYSAVEARRHRVRPGLTGLAQVNGRNSLSWQQKFAYDLDYVDRFSLAVDARVALSTVAVVFGGKGVSSPTQQVGMDEFLGTPAPRAAGLRNAAAVEPAA